MRSVWARRRAKLRRFVEEAALDHAGALRVASLPLADVRRLLELPPLPLEEVLGPHCWMVGGRLLRWFREEVDGGDCDLCFPSLQAVRTALRDLLTQGFRLKGFRAWRERVCFRCGARVGAPPRFVFFREMRLDQCPGCERLREGGGGSGRGPDQEPSFDDIVAIDRSLIRRCRLAAVELVSRQGQLVQLSTKHLYPTPEELLIDSDLTICQLATDGERLYYAASALVDLAYQHVGVGHMNYPPLTLFRIFKYGCRGFWPRGDVWGKVFAAWWQFRRRRT